ncbi:MAG: hypothetical protein IJF71_01840 [Clostridia bacterium]|nr:hypothetical protein [Clostridia bacterium]
MKKTVTILTMLMVCVLAFAGCLQLEKAESISFVTLPANTYVMGDTTAKLSFSLGITYNSGTQTDLVKFEGTWGDLANAEKPEQMTVTGFDLSTAGEKTLTVSYGTLQLTFPYTVIAYDLDGAGTAEDPILIYNREQMARMTEDYNAENATPKYYKMADGIDEIDASDWTPVYLYGSFDGNGVVFNGLDNFLFYATYNEGLTTLKNFTVNADIQLQKQFVAIIYKNYNDTTYENVTVHGYIEGTQAASFVGLGNGWVNGADGTAVNWIFKNCYSDANIVAVGGTAAGFMCHSYCGANSSVTLIDSKFEGMISATGNAMYVDANGGIYAANKKGVLCDYSANYNVTGLYTNADNTATSVTSGAKYTKADAVVKLTPVSVNVATNDAYQIGQTFTVNAGNATYAIASLIIAPNGLDETGGYAGTYMVESLEKVNGTFTTSLIKYFNIAINAEGVTESGVNGNTYNVYGEAYGTTYASARVSIVLYDARMNVININTFNF